MKLPTKWKKFLRDPLGLRCDLNNRQMLDLKNAVFDQLTLNEQIELVQLYQQTMNCAEGHFDDMAMWLRWCIISCWIYTLSVPTGNVFIIGMPLVIFALSVGGAIKESIWRMKDRQKHQRQIVDFYARHMIHTLPLPSELVKMMDKMFSTGDANVEVSFEQGDLPDEIQEMLKKKGIKPFLHTKIDLPPKPEGGEPTNGT